MKVNGDDLGISPNPEEMEFLLSRMIQYSVIGDLGNRFVRNVWMGLYSPVE
jgi:hypothetical protein